MKRVRDDLEDLLDKLGLLQKVKGFYPVVKWDNIVGVELAKYTKPLKYEDGTLLIGVSSPLFKRELEGMHEESLRLVIITAAAVTLFINKEGRGKYNTSREGEDEEKKRAG